MRFVHTNIAAKDWKLLADFYCKVFACTVKPPVRNLSGKWLNRATGLNNAALSGVHLILPGYGDTGPTLEIFTYEETQHNASIMANVTGYTHVAFEVDDVAFTLAAVLQNGGQKLGEVTEKEVAGVGNLMLVYCRDPEGNIVELQSWKK